MRIGSNGWAGLKGQLAGTAFLTAIGSALGLASQAMIARLVGQDGFGLYSFALGMSGLAQVWLALDFGQAIVRFVPGYWRGGDDRLLKEIHALSTRIVGVTAVIGLMVVAATRPVWATRAPSSGYVTLGCLLAVATTLLQMNYLFLVAIGDARRAVLGQQILRPAAIAILSLIGVWVAVPREHLALGAALIGVTGIASLTYRQVTQAIDSRENGHAALDPLYLRSIRRSWLRFSTTFLFSSAAQGLISSQLDVVLVGMMVASRESGVYAAASHLALVASLLPSVMNSVLTPHISAAYDAGTAEETRVALGRFAAAQVGSSLIGVAAVLLIGPIFLSAYGKSFGRSFPIALLLSAAGAVSSSIGTPASMVLSTMGGHRKLAIANMIIAGMAVGVSVALVNSIGSIGAAWGTLLISAIRSATLQYLARRHAPGILSYTFAISLAADVLAKRGREKVGR